MSLGRCETQSSPAHAGRRSSCTEARDFKRRGRARRSIRQTRTPLRRSRQAALNHPGETERLLCRRQSAARANPTRRNLGPEAAASTAQATRHSAAWDQFCIRAPRVSLATGPKTNSPQRAAAARREQRLCCPCPRPLQTVVVTRTATERINDERQRAAPPIGQDALAVRQKSRQRVLRAEKAMGSRSRRRLGTSAFRSRCAAGPAIPIDGMEDRLDVYGR